MKKKRLFLHWNDPRSKKLLWMKWCSSLLLSALFTLTASAHEQSKKVNLNLQQVSVKTLFDEIQRQTGLSFIYSEDQCAHVTGISVKAEQEEVEKVLDRVLHNTGLTYEFRTTDLIIILHLLD